MSKRYKNTPIIILIFVGFIKLSILLGKLLGKLIIMIIDIILAIFKLPSVKGMMGEHKVYKLLNKIKLKNDYIIKNLNIRRQDGLSSQIDHLFISKKGIFVIEVKNYNGKVYGNDYNNSWAYYVNKKKYDFYSPFKQNYIHICAISEVFGNDYNLNNIVLFVNGDISKVESKYTYNLNSFKEYYETLPIIYEQEYIDNIYNNIIKYQEEVKISKKEHIKDIKTTQDKINNNICPRCGNELVLANGKYGEFYRCIEYPECKFKKKQ